jgi:ELWxxDGT repeat protein
MIKNTILIALLTFGFSSQAQKLIKDIYKGPASSTIFYQGNIEKGMFFMAENPEFGNELWLSDGTTDGTKIVKDVSLGANSTSYTSNKWTTDSLLFIVMKAAQDSVFGLWRSNGESSGTFKLFDINNMPSDFIIKASFLDNKLYFIDIDISGNCLWATDGTANGTQLIYRFNDVGVNYKLNITTWNKQLYFFAYDSNYGIELWKSDGTTSGTGLLKDIYPGKKHSVRATSTNIISTKSSLYFTGCRDSSEGFELFKSEGSSDGTDLFIDFNMTNFASSYPVISNYNEDEILINTINDPTIFLSDGTQFGTMALEYDNAQITSSKIKWVKSFYDDYILYLEDNIYGGELRKINKLTKKIELVMDINPGTKSSSVTDLILFNNDYYFPAFNNNIGTDIWTTNGTFDNTKVFFEISEKLDQSMWHLIKFKNKLYITAKFNKGVGMELYTFEVNRLSLAETKFDKPAVYPNPVAAGQTLTLSDQACSFELYNSLGQTVWQGESTDGQSTLPEYINKGIYFISISNETGTKKTKIIVQ